MPSPPRAVEAVMGTDVAIDVRGPARPEAIAAAFACLREAEARFSTYRPGSEISRVRRGELAPADAHPDVREVLDRCAALHRDTGGAFDAIAAGGGRPDPTGLVKGWALERAAALLERHGVRDFCLDGGGDICVRGGPAPGARWRVGVRHPCRRDRLAAVLELTDAAVATSGAYERGEHIVDPRSGRPPRGVLSVTVVGPDLGTADAYATAAFALGADGPAWTATLAGHGAMTILEGGRVLATPGFLRHCPGGSVAASLEARGSASPPWP
jgi:thiamine biosynthesis lipoprotein